MDIEQLTKSQIVLLTLLVSFVTSIATGIVAVSLVDQAPPSIAQSVSRVIEKTIETVASTTPKGQTATTIVTQEKTVVIKESELIPKAVQAANPSLVRLYGETADASTFTGLGVVLDSGGTIAVDSAALGEAPDAIAVLSDGSRVRAFVVSRDEGSGIAYLRAATTTQDGKPAVFAPIGVSVEHPVLGDTVVLLSGRSATRIAAGLIVALTPASKDAPAVLTTDIPGETILPGSPLIDTSGSLIGVSTGAARASSSSGFIASSALMKPGAKKR